MYSCKTRASDLCRIKSVWNRVVLYKNISPCLLWRLKILIKKQTYRHITLYVKSTLSYIFAPVMFFLSIFLKVIYDQTWNLLKCLINNKRSLIQIKMHTISHPKYFLRSSWKHIIAQFNATLIVYNRQWQEMQRSFT